MPAAFQEQWGVTDALKELAIMLSEATGFRTLIPDLYKGEGSLDENGCHDLVEALVSFT